MFRGLIAVALLIYEIANGAEPQKMRVTCYTSPATAYTASGQIVHDYGCAGRREDIGKTAFIYDLDGELIGAYEINDTGSNYMLINGTALDIWRPSLEECHEFINAHGDYCKVIIVGRKEK